jgi:hypothetical protein
VAETEALRSAAETTHWTQDLTPEIPWQTLCNCNERRRVRSRCDSSDDERNFTLSQRQHTLFTARLPTFRYMKTVAAGHASHNK